MTADITLERLQSWIDDPPYHDMFGVRAESLDSARGEVVLRLPFRREIQRSAAAPQIHGGVIATLVDLGGEYALWVKLGDRNPSIPVKFGYGLVLLGVGFLVLAWGSTYLGDGAKVGMQWLVVTYFLHTVGELCLSPVGLSSVTKLAPDRLVGQMMGTWFMVSV